ncbi:MAG: adenosylhomocysteinase [Candidatus Aenigmatarchaeota archaeon]|nr:MAG: adenosylhomocysteinase [Candidatus Aenigmarchaeota archaeon]RLJ07443.1 MAG: adenosylhomocysteinase [Candidatus Aenigmarchaeota archaeon]RLJ08840.1 MAG: adenosylhomocysteinase [Candidatus Aenigmarchaeota archaeon]
MDKGKNYEVKNIKLAGEGKKRTEWAESQMPILLKIRERFRKEKPLKGYTVGMALHVTKETAVLVRTLLAGGANVAITGCNPLSTQDDIAAALAKEGAYVYAWRGESKKEYYENLNKVLDHKPDVTIDDGCDLVTMIHTKRKELLENLLGAAEETTTGVIRLKAMEKDGALKCPAMNVNDAKTKHMFDNYLGTSQSSLDAIMRTTNILLAGKTIVVSGYGFCGSGLAQRARGMGMIPIVTEVDPVKALKAVTDGFLVMPMRKAARYGDIFVTVTGNKSVIDKQHFLLMKDGAILANAGHFNVEINLKELEKLSVRKRKINEDIMEYTLPNRKRIFVLAEGRLVNLATSKGEGHPSEVMSMSFSNQALVVEYFIRNQGQLENKVYNVPEEIDNEVARLMLECKGIETDKLTKEQEKYISSWKEGT